jgi:uroporphyrinogen decarboxylase
MTNIPLLDVLTGGEPERRPVWLMRQAGRYLPEYRAVRAKAGSFLKLCYDPELAAEVTLQPLRRYDLDAAILFSDILVVPHAMGLRLDFVEGEGPQLDTVGDLQSVNALKPGLDAEQFGRVYETVKTVRDALKPSVGFIGFCGAPWTVASYMIEGRGSDRARAVGIASENPPWFARLLERLVETSAAYLIGQINAGVQVIQIFDSWAGDIPVAHRNRVVTEPIAAIIKIVRQHYPDFPVIVFARGIGEGHGTVARKTGASCVGVEQGIALAHVLKGLPVSCAVQGNLPPEVLLSDETEIKKACRTVMLGVPRKRHVFNLGHGITPDVQPEAVDMMLQAIRAFDHV